MPQDLQNAELMPAQMKDNIPSFMNKIQQLSEILHINLAPFQADHIAMRINDFQLAQLAHQEWQKQAQVISQAQINGRPIIVLLFDKPLEVCGWQIECLELPYPAEGKRYPQQGWEHVEFVVPSKAPTAQEYLVDLKDKFPEFAKRWDNLAQLGVKTKLSSPKGEGERLANPTIAFKWQGVCIKLHPYSLRQVISSEREV